MKNASKPTRSALDSKDTSAHTQRIQILALLREKQSVNTPEFRAYGIMAPAPRIFELKAEGYDIRKVLEQYRDSTGKVHNGVARYFLKANSPSQFNDNRGTHEEA